MAASRCPLHSLACRAMAVAESEARRDGVSAEPTRSRPCRALKNSYDGLTFFAPNDNAFTKLKTGTLNGLTDQQKIQLLLYHVLPPLLQRHHLPDSQQPAAPAPLLQHHLPDSQQPAAHRGVGPRRHVQRQRDHNHHEPPGEHVHGCT